MRTIRLLESAIRNKRKPLPEIQKPSPGMNAILLQGRIDTAEGDRPELEPVKPVKAHTETARDYDGPWRFLKLLPFQQIHVFLPFGLWDFQYRHSLLNRHTHVFYEIFDRS